MAHRTTQTEHNARFVVWCLVALAVVILMAAAGL